MQQHHILRNNIGIFIKKEYLYNKLQKLFSESKLSFLASDIFNKSHYIDYLRYLQQISEQES